MNKTVQTKIEEYKNKIYALEINNSKNSNKEQLFNFALVDYFDWWDDKKIENNKLICLSITILALVAVYLLEEIVTNKLRIKEIEEEAQELLSVSSNTSEEDSISDEIESQ